MFIYNYIYIYIYCSRPPSAAERQWNQVEGGMDFCLKDRTRFWP